MSCYKRQLRIRDKMSDMRWNSKTVRAIPYLWADSESDHQVLYRELDGNDVRRCQHFAEITMYHFLGRRMKLFESRPFNYGHLYEVPDIEAATRHVHSILSLPVGEFPRTVTIQVPEETDISTIQRFAEHVKKMLHL